MIKIDGLYKITNEKITPPHCPSFSGIVAGQCKGDLWVDNAEYPTVAIANSYPVGGFAFLGEIRSQETYNTILAFVYEELFPLLKLRKIDCFEFSIESENLRKHVLEMFSTESIQSEKEFHYRKNERYLNRLICLNNIPYMKLILNYGI